MNPHHGLLIAGTRCKAGDGLHNGQCFRSASVWLAGPGGIIDPVPGGFYCLMHGSSIVEEINKIEPESPWSIHPVRFPCVHRRDPAFCDECDAPPTYRTFEPDDINKLPFQKGAE